MPSVNPEITQQHNNERKILHTLLIACLALGFISAAAVYLPQSLKAAGAVHKTSIQPPPQLSSVLPISNDEPAQKTAPIDTAVTGPVFKFMPEEESRNSKLETRNLDNEDTSFSESRLPAVGPAAGVQSPESRMDVPDSQPLLAYKSPEREESQAAVEQAGYTHTLSSEYGAAKNVRHNVSSLVDGSSGKHSDRGEQWWLAPKGLEKDVAFWRDVYSKYSGNEVVLHDPENLHMIYDVVDVGDINNNFSLTDSQKRELRKARVQSATDDITSTIKLLATDRETALRTKRGKKIAELFVTSDNPDKFKIALEHGIRSQTGQRDKFLEGLKHSGAWLGEIELIFKSYNLPRELTRIIFVESMFQTNARSKVGAAGIWQFMRDTGLKYLRINRFVDERLDPLLESHAAAKLLQHNYEVLGTWPLAINAYNSGRGRLEQAVARLGTTDIGTIIKNFDHPGYQFASRNFFLEFAAAKEVVDNAEKYFGKIDYEKPLSYDVIELPFFISFPEVPRLSDASMEELIALNPQFTDEVYGGSLPVPTGTTLRVPENKGTRFLEMAQRSRTRTSQPFEHVVSSGETLPEIASMYGVPIESIKGANPSLKQRPHAGQRLMIPIQ